MSSVNNNPLPHNVRPAAVWGSGARTNGYRLITWSIGDAIESAVTLLDLQPGERVLDVATGTGNAARRAAARGAKVIGSDFSQEYIDAAKGDSPSIPGVPPIEYMVGDAEKLPFEDASFDVVVSTFGVMFASNHEAAAAELARVVRPGGRLALTTWTPDSTIAGMFGVHKKYMPPPPPGAKPAFLWGDREYVKGLLGTTFDLKFRDGTSVYTGTSGIGAWNLFYNGYGPTRTLADSLTYDKRNEFMKDFVDFHDQYKAEIGIAMPRKYIITIGTRK